MHDKQYEYNTPTKLTKFGKLILVISTIFMTYLVMLLLFSDMIPKNTDNHKQNNYNKTLILGH